MTYNVLSGTLNPAILIPYFGDVGELRLIWSNSGNRVVESQNRNHQIFDSFDSMHSERYSAMVLYADMPSLTHLAHYYLTHAFPPAKILSRALFSVK